MELIPTLSLYLSFSLSLSLSLQQKSLQGDPAAALLEVLDPEQNSTFTDQYPPLTETCSLVFPHVLRGSTIVCGGVGVGRAQENRRQMEAV